jgi:hypothetical protein
MIGKNSSVLPSEEGDCFARRESGIFRFANFLRDETQWRRVY